MRTSPTNASEARRPSVCYFAIVLVRVAPLLLLLVMGCAKAAPNTSSMQDARTAGSDATVSFADAGVRVDAGASACLPQVKEAWGTPPLLSTTQFESSGSYTFYANLVDGPFQRLFISLRAGKGVFAGVPAPFSAIRYHSLAVRRDGLPDCLEVTAWTEDGTIMGLRHRAHPVEGIQFHPESFMTEHGKNILRNFLNTRGSP